jgi:hypothetical protein
MFLNEIALYSFSHGRIKEKAMPKAAVDKKRPCRICGHWFTPNRRVKGRQMTCGNPQCKREWHRRKCAEWNKKNPEYFRANYLHRKLEAITQSDQDSSSIQSGSGSIPPPSSIPPPRGRLSTGLPLQQVQEAIGIKQLVILEYFAQCLVRRFQEALLRAQGIANTG